MRRSAVNTTADRGDCGCQTPRAATSGPATESVVIEQPAAGTYAVWVHVFDDRGRPDAAATVALRLDDGDPVQLLTQTLPATCAAWHVADVSFPAGTFSNLSEPLAEVCR